MAETTTKKRTTTKKAAATEADGVPETKEQQTELKEESKEKQVFTLEQVQDMIRKAAEEAAAKARSEMAQKNGDEVVTVAYLAEVSQDSELLIPGYGSMRPQSYIEIPKKEFGNKFMSTLVRKLIAKRHLIVLDGLTQDERERWNCNYKEGELLDEHTFDKMLDYPTDKLAEIFEKLCPEHQRFVACRMITAKERGDNRISVEKARRINELSKKNDPAGMLKPVMEAFGAEITA